MQLSSKIGTHKALVLTLVTFTKSSIIFLEYVYELMVRDDESMYVEMIT